jgi:hypothetical protein
MNLVGSLQGEKQIIDEIPDMVAPTVGRKVPEPGLVFLLPEVLNPSESVAR